MNTPAATDAERFAQLRSILTFVFDEPAERLTLETSLHDLPQWSSLSYIVLLTAIESQLGLKLDRDRGWGAETIGDLVPLLQDAA